MLIFQGVFRGSNFPVKGWLVVRVHPKFLTQGPNFAGFAMNVTCPFFLGGLLYITPKGPYSDGNLGGGLKYFLEFSPRLFGEDGHFD